MIDMPFCVLAQANDVYSVSPAKWLIAIGILVVVVMVGLVALIAIAAKRPGLAAIFGGLVLLAVGFGLMVLSYNSRVMYSAPPEAMQTFNSFPHTGVGYSHQATTLAWGISFFKIFIVLATVLALVIAGIVRLANGKLGSGRGNWWPALLLFPLVGMFLIGGVRYSSHREFGTPATLTPAPPHYSPPEQQAVAEMHLQIDHGDIHALMDKTDEPRIALAAEAAAGIKAMQEIEAKDPSSDSAERDTKDVKTTTAVVEVEAEDTQPESGAEKESDDATKAADSDASDEHDEVAEETSNDKKKSDDADSEVAVDTKRATVSPPSEKVEVESDEKRSVPVRAPKDTVPAETIFADMPKQNTEPRPEWLNQQPMRIGDSWQEVIATDEYATDAECRRATDIYLMYKTYERIQTLCGRAFVDSTLPSLTFDKGVVHANGNMIYDDRHQPAYWYDSRLNQLLNVGVGIDFIRREIVEKQYREESERSFGPMYKLHTLIKFTPAVDEELRRHWAFYQRQERFAVVGGGAGLVLASLGFIWGLLKVDTLTKGYYTKRLFIGVPAAIIGGFLLIVLFDVIT